MADQLSVAVVGHSLTPRYIQTVEGANIHIFRSPGAKASSFITNSIAEVLNLKHDLTILFIGGNDIHNNCMPAVITNDICGIIEQIHHYCNSHICFVLLEHRNPVPGNRFDIDADQYNRVANSINNRLKGKYKNKPYVQFLSVTAKPFQNGTVDGIHFDRDSQVHLERKFRNTIKRFVDSNR